MPREIFGPDYSFLERDELLSFEEIERLARIFIACGTQKIRITGGEPLVRRELPKLVRRLSRFPAVEDLAMTTNGLRLPQFADSLRTAGLKRITVSLDSLDQHVYTEMTGLQASVNDVLLGIRAAEEAGFQQLKINCVVKKGVNDGSVVDLAKHFHESGHILRFIEYMDVGNTNGWRLDQVVPGISIVRAIDKQLPLEPIEPNYPAEVARRWRYRDGGGEIGIITSVTQPFCETCTRIRLSPEGRLFTCLFASKGLNLRELLRSECSDTEISSAIQQAWSHRSDRYSQIRTGETRNWPKVEMSYIGG
jgi:cyclic pyranopterin phosphate synthase